MASPVNSEHLIIPAGSTDVCAAILAMAQSIAVYRSDLDYRVDPDDGMPAQEFLDDLALRIPQLYGDATFNANAYNLTVTQVFTTNQDLKGRLVGIKLADANTGPATLQINELTPAPILQNGSSPLAGGEMVAGKVAILIFDGSSFHLLNPEDLVVEEGRRYTSPSTFPLPTVVGIAAATVVDTGLGGPPGIVCCWIRCIDELGDAGYSKDDEVLLDAVLWDTGVGGSDFNIPYTVQRDGEDILVTRPSGSPKIMSKTNGEETVFTPSKWGLLVNAIR